LIENCVNYVNFC